jgi:hypothetical protein
MVNKAAFLESHISSTGSTATTSSTTPAPVDGTSCSASTSTSNASISNYFVVSPASMDSCESDAAEELLTPYPRKRRTTDRDVGPSKRRKYDENYIDLGFTYIGSSAFPQPQCVILFKSEVNKHLSQIHLN